MEYLSIWEKDAWEDGFEKGKKEESVKIAKRMLQIGMDIHVIAESVELPIEEIKKLAAETSQPRPIYKKL